MSETLRFDHYEVLTREDGKPFELGRGAMGITYKAFDTSLRIPVALKVINGTYLNSEVARQRFIREARSAAKLRHRHVASVFHLGMEGDAYFYAMEYIEGETLDAYIKRQGPMAPLLALQIADQVARALNAAQPHGLVHRDIKPANLMLVHEDDELSVKVIDFGLAKSFLPGENPEDAATLSMGGFVGTPLFASPEQLEEGDIDVRSDIYSLGVTLWFMLAGQTPFSGSTAQVMSQHLSRTPPFEKLAQVTGPVYVPGPVSDLLASMLEKDPAKRPQNGAELRRAIEDTIRTIAASQSAAAAATPNSKGLQAILANTAQTQTHLKVEPGSVIAGRYKIVAALAETNIGRAFHARDVAGDRHYRLLFLNPDLLEGATVENELEAEIAQARKSQHPNLLEVYGLERVEGATLISMGLPQGFSLQDLLRARRSLTSQETLTLLEQAAAGVDFATGQGLTRLDLSLAQIFLDFEPSGEDPAGLVRLPLSQWPAFRLKLYPLGITKELSLSETWNGDQTLLEDPSAPGSGTAPNPYVVALGTVVYELLGGSLQRQASGQAVAQRYTPLAALSEKGNEVLQRALDPSSSYVSAGTFLKALAEAEAGGSVRVTSTAGISAPPPIPSQPTKPVPAPGVSPSAALPANKSPRALGIPILVGTCLVLVVGLGIAYLKFGNGVKTEPKPPTSSITKPTPVSDPEPTPVVPPKVAEIPVATPPPKPKPTPVKHEPTRQELLKAATDEANLVESTKDWENALRSWLRIARSFPESEVGRFHLETLLEMLRKRDEAINAREFPELEPLITEAAQLDVKEAMMYLGDGFRKTEPRKAYNWYTAAAARGQVAAMRIAGLMLSNGIDGGEPDLETAFSYFQMASDKDDNDAKYLLGECLLLGKGTAKDEKRATDLLQAAADAGVLNAMDRLADSYRRGIGVEKDLGKALQLYTRASDSGFPPSMGNLGVMYIMGEGVDKPDPRKGVALFQKGVQNGNAYSMYCLAKAFEKGIDDPDKPGVKILEQDRDQARNWYKKAAEAGIKPAIEWCRKSGVLFTPR